MRTRTFNCLLFALLVMLTCLQHTASAQQGPETWTAQQLMPPATLAKILNEGKAKVYVFNIGPVGHIKNSINVGESHESASLDRLKQAVSKLPKDASIVLYCGCCPFRNCPNVRPAFQALTQMHFKNHQLLNLSQNLKVDWIDKGYPMQSK